MKCSERELAAIKNLLTQIETAKGMQKSMNEQLLYMERQLDDILKHAYVEQPQPAPVPVRVPKPVDPAVKARMELDAKADRIVDAWYGRTGSKPQHKMVVNLLHEHGDSAVQQATSKMYAAHLRKNMSLEHQENYVRQTLSVQDFDACVVEPELAAMEATR